MLDDSVRLMVMWKYNVYSWDMPDGVVRDIHRYVEVGYAGRLCPAHDYVEVYSWDMPDSCPGHS